ncbi:pre-mRNA-splicing factor 38B isoform X2 [Thalassophryne amazonica]|uniref:pre-mRNA-splicing factor 38B isoform X2 n=1 Tax=Thalassophryne amazonica TaxID=390379 RepID=UPI0014716175|nr:pre-mRNA-splicing factor 38B isoform X2 [Thalassophryne amazonica]
MMANVGLVAQAVSKPAPGKHGNVLPLWGNEKTMNLNPMILTNVLSSPYFKVQLYELKTYHEVVDEIYFKVTHVEPWEKGSRKTAGQTGMCGGVRGVGTGGIVSTAFCLLYKLFTLKLTRKQLMGLITHTDSPYIRALGFMYIRYTQPPTDLIDWYDGFLDDDEMPIVQQELDVKAGGGCVMTIGEMLRSFLTKLEWFSTLFPRIPVPVQKIIDQQIKARPRKAAQKETPDDEAASTDAGRQWERHRSRTPRRTPSPRRSPKRSRSRSHHRDRHGPGFDRELERERDRQRKERDGRDRDRDRGDRGDRERRRSRSTDRNQDRRERKRSHSGSRDRRNERREKERDGGDDRSRRKDRDHHKDRGSERDRSRDKKSRGETDDRRHKDDRERHREERKSKRSSRSRSRERRHKSGRTDGGEEKSRKRECSHSRERERDGEQRSHKRSRSKERSHHQRDSSNDRSKHSERLRSRSTE